MWVWLDSAAPVLFDAALSCAIFLTIVVLAMLVCRQPMRRLLIARVAIIASLAMIPLVALVPLPRLDVLDTFLQSDIVTASLVDEFDLSEIEQEESPALRQHARLVAGLPLHDRFLASGEWLPRGLMLIDLGCVGMGLAWLMLGIWGVRWLIRNSRPPSAASQEIFESLFVGDVKRRIRPSVRITSRVHHPVVVGFFRPTILLPCAFDEPGRDPELLRLSLLHELAHADRRDPWFGAFASLAQTVWFFLPQIWWLRSQLIIDQEFLADRFAASRYGTSSGYAASLLSLARPHSGVQAERRTSSDPIRNSVPAGPCEIRSPLSQRVLMLLHCPFRLELCLPRFWSWTLRITLVMATLVAACLCVRWPHASALEHRVKHGTTRSRPTFRVRNFTAEPRVFSKGGRALSYMMPVELPPNFELSVDVFCTSAGLGRVRIAGHPLGASEIGTEDSHGTPTSFDTVESWHSVRLQRVGPDLSLWVDGRSISSTSTPETTTEWLTFEPDPERATHFRDLRVEW